MHSLNSGPETRDPGPWDAGSRTRDPGFGNQDTRLGTLGLGTLGLGTLGHGILTPETLEMDPGAMRLATDPHHRSN